MVKKKLKVKVKISVSGDDEETLKYPYVQIQIEIRRQVYIPLYPLVNFLKGLEQLLLLLYTRSQVYQERVTTFKGHLYTLTPTDLAHITHI